MIQTIDEIRKSIKTAAEKSGRKAEDITLIAVTKTVPVERILPVVQQGVTELGENRVQELVDKYDRIRGVNWHLIGHLQTNKVKYVIDKVKLIHSVDSLKLANQIDSCAKKINKVQDVLVQVNLTGEESKFGVAPENVEELLKDMAQLGNIKVKGIMFIPPIYTEADKTRQVFSLCNKIMVDIRAKNMDNIDMNILSMGMSNDYEIAIEQGSNMVRLGRTIFGNR